MRNSEWGRIKEVFRGSFVKRERHHRRTRKNDKIIMSLTLTYRATRHIAFPTR